MTNEELKILAVDIVDGKVFGSWDVPQELIAAVFVPLQNPKVRARLPEDVSCLYQYKEQAVTTIKDTSTPAFKSFKYLTHQDRERLVPMMERYKSMKQEFIDAQNF